SYYYSIRCAKKSGTIRSFYDLNEIMNINPWQRESTRVRFTGENARFRRIVIRGALLELVTFGFYRFWLATEMRQYLWSSTEIDGDALEYTGRGKELLLGFLVAMAI